MRQAFNRFVERHEVAWELGMGSLAIIYVWMGFATDDLSDREGAVLRGVELLLTLVFIAEFASRFAASFDRRSFLRGHWLDLVALIPTVRQLRVLRLLRLLRLVRTFAGIYRALIHIERVLGNRQIAAIAVVWLAVLVLTSFGLYVAERGVNDAVQSPLDALWWGIVTMTTVGYGDIYPITAEGRVAAGILMVLGIALFGIVTATTTGLLLKHEAPAAADIDPLERLSTLHALSQNGAITPEEYAAAKARLLRRV